MIDYEFGRRERVDRRCIAAEFDDRIAHRGEIDNCGHPGEVLQDHAGGGECNLLVGLGLRIPVGKRIDISGADVAAAGMAQQIFQQYFERERQFVDVSALDGAQAKVVVV